MATVETVNPDYLSRAARGAKAAKGKDPVPNVLSLRAPKRRARTRLQGAS